MASARVDTTRTTLARTAAPDTVGGIGDEQSIGACFGGKGGVGDQGSGEDSCDTNGNGASDDGMGTVERDMPQETYNFGCGGDVMGDDHSVT